MSVYVYKYMSVGGILKLYVFFFQAEDGIRDLVRSRGLGDVYKRQRQDAGRGAAPRQSVHRVDECVFPGIHADDRRSPRRLSLIHI